MQRFDRLALITKLTDLVVLDDPGPRTILVNVVDDAVGRRQDRLAVVLLAARPGALVEIDRVVVAVLVGVEAVEQQIPAAEMERMMKAQEVILKAAAGKLKWWEAAEIMGEYAPDETAEEAAEILQEGDNG